MRPAVKAGLVLGVLFCLSFTVSTPSLAQEAGPHPVLAEAHEALQRTDLTHEHRVQLELFIKINEFRLQHGLHPLTLDARLNAAAWDHSVDMASNRYCRHGGTDGSSSRVRMSRHGYPYNNWAGENIVCGQDSAGEALTWWQNSPPHRRNLLHHNFTHIGIAIAPHGPWGPMYTLNFADGAPDTVTPIVFNDPSPVQVVEAVQ